MKLWKRLILFLIISLISNYLVNVFITMECNLFVWHPIVRVSFVMWSFTCTFILNMIYLGEKGKL